MGLHLRIGRGKWNIIEILIITCLEKLKIYSRVHFKIYDLIFYLFSSFTTCGITTIIIKSVINETYVYYYSRDGKSRD